MLRITINGRTGEIPEGSTILEAIHAFGGDVPTLCHDERLQPSGACRICIVEVKGWERHATACNTPVIDGMEITTHSPAVEQNRRTILKLLAHAYPESATASDPSKPFHQCLLRYDVTPNGEKATHAAYSDTSHPYIRVDMQRCIQCDRCIRICDEVQGQFAWRAWNRGDARLILPDSGTTLLESSCVSCGACADTCPTGALEDKSVLATGVPDRWTRTTCPYCGTGCEMWVGTRADRIVQVKPVLDAPVSKGHLCVKGRYAFDFVHSEDRITEPMIREQETWRKVSWAEAIHFTTERLRDIISRHGPDSIGVLGSARATNEENYVAQKFARVVLGTNNVDCCARVCHAPTAAGMKMTLGTGAATNSFDDIEHTAGFLICGCNPTENHPIVGARIKQAVLRGAKLIVIDPRKIELTRYANLHLPIRPGTNVVLLNAIAHVLVKESLIDESFVQERIQDYSAFQEFISNSTPEVAAPICGVDADLIRQAARVYASAKPAMCFHGLGMTEHIQGTEGVVCLVNLALLTGNLGKPGSGVNPLRGQNNVQGAAHMGCEPTNLTGYVAIDQFRDAFETAWQAKLPHTRGLNLMQMIDAAEEQKLKALWAIGYDIAFTNPNAAATKASLARLDLVVVQDIFLNELARECGHVFLPACSTFEKDGTFMNSERRVQRVRQAIPSAGASRADWEIICDIARAMGHGDQFAFRSAEEIWNEVRQVWKAGAGISYQRLESGGLQWPCPSEDHPGTTILHRETFALGKQTSLRRIDFHATAETTTAKFPYLLTTGRTLYQFNAGTMTMRTANVQFRSTDTLDISPSDANRLQLVTGERVRIRSRHGETEISVRVDPGIQPGELFATFHATEIGLNQLTSPQRDAHVQTPEYKVVAVSLEKL